MAYTSSQIVQAVPTGINSALVCVKAETAFSAASSVTADSVFTSTYTNYLLKINYTTSSSGDVYIKLRASGTSASTNYNKQRLYGQNTSTGADRADSQTSLLVGYNSNGDYKSSLTLEIFSPQIAQPTSFILANNASLGGYNGGLMLYAAGCGNHTTATAYDGIEILVGSGTMTGNYTIYGYGKSV